MRQSLGDPSYPTSYVVPASTVDVPAACSGFPWTSLVLRNLKHDWDRQDQNRLVAHHCRISPRLDSVCWISGRSPPIGRGTTCNPRPQCLRARARLKCRMVSYPLRDRPGGHAWDIFRCCLFGSCRLSLRKHYFRLAGFHPIFHRHFSCCNASRSRRLWSC